MVKFRYSGSKTKFNTESCSVLYSVTKLTIVTLLRPDVNICFDETIS